MMKGRRRTPDEFDPTSRICDPGDYYFHNGSWYGMTPNDLLCWFKNHHVEEHEDGSISIAPVEGRANSILASNGTGNKKWHGYIFRGVWTEC